MKNFLKTHKFCIIMSIPSSFIDTIVMTNVIHITPDKMNNLYKTHIFNKLKETFNGTCNKNGFILETKEIKNITGGKLSVYNACPYYDVSALFDVFVPKKNVIYPSIVKNIYNTGLDTCVFDCLNVFIMVDASFNKHGFTYDMNKKQYTKGNIVISVGSQINLTIKTIKYSDKKFSCIGEISI